MTTDIPNNVRITDAKEFLISCRALIDSELDRLIPKESAEPERVHSAIRWSLFAGGKRFRPALLLATGQTFGANNDDLLRAGCALEMIHTYSLIHDDLPALDNDDLRRGRPTCHKVFSEAMAILAGDALLTRAFEVLASLPDVDDTRKARLVYELASAAGDHGGMIAGQVHDLEGEHQRPTAHLLERIHRAKTGALLRASVRMGALYAGADEHELNALSRYGEHIGLAFQIVDDLLDVEQSSEQLGKTAGKDAQQHKITFPSVYGVERSHAMAEEERLAAHRALQPFDARAIRLRQIADLIVQRTA